MLRSCIKRIILIPVILLVALLIVFSLVNLSRVNPATEILGPSATQEEIDRLTEEMGLDDPVIIQFLNYVKGILHGDFGESYYTKEDVLGQIARRWSISVRLALIAVIAIVAIGGTLGVLCAVYQYSWLDTIVNVISKCLASVPTFWLALMFLLLFSLKLKWFPSHGLESWRSWVLPVITMVIPDCCTYLRNSRSAMLDCIRQDYVRTARSKGNKERVVIFKHALKNALLPLITITGMVFNALMGGAVVAETVYSIPGLGNMVLTAIKQKDIPLVVGGVFFLTVIFQVITLVIDLLYAAVDPRVRASFASQGMRKRKRKVIHAGEEA